MQSVRFLLLSLLLSLPFPLCALPPSAAPSADQVRRAAEVLYIHGMTREIADTEIGPSGVPELLRLLRDPVFDRRDNVVAFLAYLGDADTVPELLRFLEQPPFSTSVPEEDRALLLVPEALGRITGRTGDARALAALLDLTSGDLPLERGLVEMGVYGLMFSGAAEARARLDEISQRHIVPVVGFDLAGNATSCLEWLDREDSETTSSTPTDVSGREEDDALERTAFRTLAPDALGTDASAVPADFDLSTVTHELSIDYVNHVDLESYDRMNDFRLDDMFEVATELVGLEDFGTDVACCATLIRPTPGGIFGRPDDGLDILTTEWELNIVLSDPIARAKVVRHIGWCGHAPQTNAIGCGKIAGFGFAVVRYGNLAEEAVLWTHEFGHNLGLGHVSDGRYIMNRSIAAVGGLLANECQKFHFPASGAEITPLPIGTCSDEDGDGRHAVIDNCPQVSNPDQADGDGDGVGNVCDNCRYRSNSDQHDDDQDLLGNACDNCPGTANAGQSDVDQDEVGDVCDNCPTQLNPRQEDGDEDFVGDVCDNCPAQSNTGQENHDTDGFGDVCDNCPTQNNPGQEDGDEDFVGDVCDNCPAQSNTGQANHDTDGFGDVCDNCPTQNNPGQEDGDEDFVGDVCDNCPAQSNTGQENNDTDGFGDVCDNCPFEFNPGQTDFDGDAIGDVCEDGALLSDADGSGKVDGFDLVRLARAFGSWASDPTYEVTVDLDRNGHVDGEDLAILAGYFGDLVD